nr:hypothetical protein [uncultured Oscillibacter sp.]
MKKQIALGTLFTLVLLLVMTVSASAEETEENTDLPQLATPTKLTWGRDYDWNADTYQEVPGYISWKRESPTQNKYQTIVYSRETGKKVSSMWTDYGFSDTSPYFSSTQFIEGYWYDDYGANDDYNFDSGTYYFTVQALGDGTEYSDSEIATSPDWTYTKPTAILATPTGLYWNGRESHWSPPADMSDVGGYVVEYYWYDAESQKYISVGGTSCLGSYSLSDESPEDYLEDYCIEEYGAGQYYFRVRILSRDITKVRSSLWSELSPVYNLTDVSAGIDSTLDSLLDSYDTGGDLTDDEKTALKEELWETDTDSLDVSMAADQTNSGTVSKIEALENLVGGQAEVSVSDDAPAGLTSSNISIIGANLNTEGDAKATLNVSAPSKDAVIPELYNNTVQFSMKLDGVNETEQGQELKVPVKITMPVPDGIDPDFLVLLHFHSDGTYEEIEFPYIFEENGQTFVSFVVTSFSDFAFAQRAFAISSIDPEAQNITAAVGSKTAGTLVAAIYDENGRMTGAATAPVTAGDPKNVVLSLPSLTEGSQVKLFLLDSSGAPLYEAISKTVH